MCDSLNIMLSPERGRGTERYSWIETKRDKEERFLQIGHNFYAYTDIWNIRHDTQGKRGCVFLPTIPKSCVVKRIKLSRDWHNIYVFLLATSETFFPPLVRCTGKLSRKYVHCAITHLPNHWKNGNTSTKENDTWIGRPNRKCMVYGRLSFLIPEEPFLPQVWIPL